MFETSYEVMRRQGITRRSFLKFCSLTAASLGLGDAGAQQIQKALETKPRTPVIWLHGLECTCCTESFIRSAHPLAKDVVLSMISLDYDDTIMAAAGHQAEEALEQTITKYKGNYILAVEGNPPLADDGIYCIPGGKPFVEKLKHAAKDAMAVISWGSCASWGCVQAAKPNPTISLSGRSAHPSRAVAFRRAAIHCPIAMLPSLPNRTRRRLLGAAVTFRLEAYSVNEAVDHRFTNDRSDEFAQLVVGIKINRLEANLLRVRQAVLVKIADHHYCRSEDARGRCRRQTDGPAARDIHCGADAHLGSDRGVKAGR